MVRADVQRHDPISMSPDFRVQPRDHIPRALSARGLYPSARRDVINP